MILAYVIDGGGRAAGTEPDALAGPQLGAALHVVGRHQARDRGAEAAGDIE